MCKVAETVKLLYYNNGKQIQIEKQNQSYQTGTRQQCANRVTWARDKDINQELET